MGNIIPIQELTPRVYGHDRFGDRVHSRLLLRIEGTLQRRKELAIMPDDDAAFEIWTRERDRGDKLKRALVSWLLHRSLQSPSQHQNHD